MQSFTTFAGSMTSEKIFINIYAESTPNPASMKFVANIILLNQGSVEYLNAEQAVNSPLAKELFQLDGIASVFIAANFVTITKKPDFDWFELMPQLREFIKGYLESEKKVFAKEDFSTVESP